MWWPTQARSPRASAERALQLGAAGQQRRRAAPAAAAAPARSRASAAGPAARAGAHDRVVRARVDRAVVQQEQVGDAGEALQRVVVPVGDRLVGHVAARHARAASPASASSRWCSGEYGSITPRSRERGATASATRAPGRRGASTIGRSRVQAAPRLVAVPGRRTRRPRRRRATISANGLSSRCLRARRVATARSSSARQARWKPPMPLTATIAPAESASATAGAGRLGPASGADREPQPRAARPGRRSAARGSGGRAGPRTRPGSAAHIANAGHRGQRTVVRDAADDGEPRAAVGAVDERVAVAAVGRVEQLAQAVRAGRGVRRDAASGRPPRGDSRDGEARLPRRRRPARRARARSRASGGASARQPRQEASMPPASPSTSSSTPARRSTRTRPARVDEASPNTNGRKPTPWTVPSTGRTGPGVLKPAAGPPARATRSPAPPGCAGCAPSARRRRGRRAPRRRSGRRRSRRTPRWPARAGAPRPARRARSRPSPTWRA